MGGADACALAWKRSVLVELSLSIANYLEGSLLTLPDMEVNNQRAQLIAIGGVSVDFGRETCRVAVLVHVLVCARMEMKDSIMRTVSATFSTSASIAALRNFSSSRLRPMKYA